MRLKTIEPRKQLIQELFDLNRVPEGVDPPRCYSDDADSVTYVFSVNKKKYECVFKDLGDGNYDLKFRDDKGLMTITGAGDSAKVFWAVAKAISKFVEEKTVKVLKFGANEPSRARLYDVLSKKMAQTMGWRREVARPAETGDPVTYFRLYNPRFEKEALEEGSLTLDNGARVISNPSPAGLATLARRAKWKTLRGLIHGSDVYWWDADLAIHGTVARAVGHQDYTDDRLEAVLVRNKWIETPREELRMEVDDTAWPPSRLRNHPQMRRLLSSSLVYWHEPGEGWISGPEYAGRGLNEAEVPGTQFVTLDAAQLKEGLTWLEELAENINDESTQYEYRPDLYKKLERDHRAITAVETVMRNNLKALKNPELGATSIFLYDVDDSDLSYMDFVGAIHVVLHEDHEAEVKWIGSYDADGGGLLRAAMKIAKERGATHMKLDAKWESEGFYHKMGFKQSGPTVDQPLSGSQLTPFHRELDEVVMSPNALKTWVRQNADILAGVKIGFEAEMCVPDLTRSSDDDDAEHEPDYSDDEEISNYNWQSDIKRWFQEHDADGMNGRNEVEGAIDQCQSEIDDWISDQMSFSESEIKEVISSNNPDFSDEEVEESFDNQDGEYDTAVEELQQSVYENFEFSDWGRGNRCRKMSDFVSKYDLIWPVYQSSGGSGGGEMSYSELADSWTETSGYTSTASTRYHSAKRQPDLWIFEPDSSIEPDYSDDEGVELVSPPMPFGQGIAALAKFFQWAPSVNAYANQSCGFHIGVSLPPEVQQAIDPVKLLLFLGDEHVLAEFGRSFNTYTKSSMKSLRQRIQQWISQNYSTPQDGLAFIKSTLADPAQSVLPQMARRGDHYVSVNIKDNYIEFRSAGGDYFEKQQEIFNTVMRYVRAMTIASDPQAEKQEYLKKLYKLLAGSIQQPDNPMGAFMRYSAGQITRDELLKTIQQKAPSNQPPGADTAQTPTATGESWQHYEILRARDEFKVHEFLAPNLSAALEKKAQWCERTRVRDSDYILRRPSPSQLAEKWSQKYKKVIDCSHPRGFSQRAHCAGRKKRQAHGKTSSRSVSETAQNSEIHSYHKLDRILVKLCDLVDSRRAQDPEKYGLVGAALLDPKNQIATGVSTKHDGQWIHAERRAIVAYRKKYGSIPEGCIIVVTCSPCSERMDSRHGDSCTDLINSSAVKKVYCGFDDETQPENQREFNIIETADPEIRDRCRGYAEQFMDWEVEQMKETSADGVDQTSPVTETLKKVKGRWALVSRKNPKKVLQYYHGSGHPSKEWVSKVERRVHSFSENFANGRGPGRPGDSQRHGIPKNATRAQLTKAAKSKGRKGQLARWQLNMRRGHQREGLEEDSSSIIDNQSGWGNVPNNLNVEYLGLRVRMQPSVFLQLAAHLPREQATNLSAIRDHLQGGGKIASPFLVISIPEAWENGDLAPPARVINHEGRHRMMAVQELHGNRPIEVHLFFSGFRARHLQAHPEWIRRLEAGVCPERMTLEMPFDEPWFELTQAITESRFQEVVHRNPSMATLKALAKNNRYHSARFVIYNDGDLMAGDSEHFTHQMIAPAIGAWEVRGYVQYLGDNDYAYRSMEQYSALNKDHPLLRRFEKAGIENGNSDQSHLNQPLEEAKPAGVKSYQTTWRGARAEYDPEFFDVEPDELRDQEGQLVASKERLRPKPHLQSRLPTKANPNLVYRGMSNAEYEHILQTGKIESRGDYNFDVQKGLTYFSTDPEAAESYAHSFAPWQHKATWDNPAWVIAIPRPDPSRVRKVRGTGEHEVGIEGSIPASEIREVYRGRAVEYRPGEPNREAPSAWLHWERVPVTASKLEEVFAADAPLPQDVTWTQDGDFNFARFEVDGEPVQIRIYYAGKFNPYHDVQAQPGPGYDVEFVVGSTQSVTGTWGTLSLRVLEPVVSVLRDWFSSHPWSWITFAGSGEPGKEGRGRIGLYRRISHLLAQRAGAQVNERPYIGRRRGGSTFVIYKPAEKSSVDEAGGVGLVVPGVNMPAGQHRDEIRRQAKKFGNRVSSKGVPPTIKTNGLFESVSGDSMWNTIHQTHHEPIDNPEMERFVRSHQWGIEMIQPQDLTPEEELFDRDDPFDRIIDIDPSRVKWYVRHWQTGRAPDPIVRGPQGSVIDGNHRAQAAIELNQPIQAYVPMEKIEEEVWDQSNPKKTHRKLTPARKAAAKRRARKAGRKYPNLVDNMWASKGK